MRELIYKEAMARGCQAAILTHPSTVTWAAGLVSSNALLYVDAKNAILVTDSRYAEAASRVERVEVVIATGGDLASRLSHKIRPKTKVGYQSDWLSVSELDQIRTALPTTELTPIGGFLEEQIAVKRPDELAKITAAQAITDKVFTQVLPLLTPGVTEQAVAAEIVYRQLQAGADGISPEFWPIVAFGPNSALPHAKPGKTKLKSGDAILLDFGCTVGGYCSDMTRTLCLGEPGDEFRLVYQTVLMAQEAALAAAKAGLSGKELDAVARRVIVEAGYGEAFGHGLGHGVGLDIHEWPRVSSRSNHVLTPDTVITVEPGIYLPGKFGVRIEDMIVLTKDGSRNLTRSPKDLIIL